MAKIVKKQEVELGLEELIALLKKNWSLLAGFLVCNLAHGNKIVVKASFNLVGICDALHRDEGLTVDANELEGVITQIFREIEHQRPYFKNMAIRSSGVINPKGNLNVFFEIDISPIMPVDPLNIPGPDNPVDYAPAR